MTTINLIAAIGNQGQLGLNGKLPWHCPSDLQWFQETTKGGLLIVGHNTYPTVKHLNGTYGRVFLVDNESLTREYVSELAAALFKENVWIAGGAKTYEKWLKFVDRMYIARVNYDGPADRYFPSLF